MVNEKSSILEDSRAKTKWFNIYIATLPLAFIFLFDILPSRISLIFIRYLVNDESSINNSNDNVESLYDFDAMFAAYGFTNFFVVFILSLSCGLDTLSKQQLRNVEYLRDACALVILGCVPYIVGCIFSREILYNILKQPSFMIDRAYYAILYLIPYCLSYVIFAMMRKSLLQYLNSSLLVGIMFVRLCSHIMVGYFLYEYYSETLGFYCFAISDSLSMVFLLFITMFTLRKYVNFTNFMQGLFCCMYDSISGSSGSNISHEADGSSGKQIMRPSNSTANTQSTNLAKVGPSTTIDTGSSHHHNESHSNIEQDASSSDESDSLQLFKEYIAAMIIPGMISCLEWWAIESITWMVGAMSSTIDENSEDYISIYIYYFVHGMYSSLLLFFQMPVLGLSVAMAAMITGDIRLGRFESAFYTFMQGLLSCISYCIVIGAILLFSYNDGLLSLIFNLPNENSLYNNINYNKDYKHFISDIYSVCESINLFFIISLVCYSIAMCLLSLFVSVGRLAHGGAFMLMGYLLFGVLVAAIFGFSFEWHLYGIWFGYACGFVVWALLSSSYWMCCSKWKVEMQTMKLMYDQIDNYEENTKMFKEKLKTNNNHNNNLKKNYGTM